MEKAQLEDSIKIDVVVQVLPIMDSVLSAMKMDIEVIEPLYQQLTEIFAKMGVTETPAVGCEFDPNLHNAVMHEEDENNKEKNIITEEFAKGYKLGDRIIRHSLVKVVN